MFPKKLLEQILPFPAGIDYHDHWIAFVAATTGPLHYLETPLSSYRRHENNVSISIPGQKTKKKFKSPKVLIAKNKKRQKILKDKHNRLIAWSKLPALAEEDRILILTLAGEFKKSLWKRYNKRLQRIIHENPELLDVYKNKDSAIRHNCRGAFLRF
jgi:hypothetical protein